MTPRRPHSHHYLAQQCPPDWRPALPPKGDGVRVARLRACSFCGSMHPSDLADAIGAGAKVSWSDFKYGWPHKIYVDEIPNPHVGLMEIRSCQSCSAPPRAEIDGDAGQWERYQDGFDARTGEPRFAYRILGPEVPAPALTHGKFYSEHLLDATDDERVAIERAMGLHFDFNDDGSVRWSAFKEPATS